MGKQPSFFPSKYRNIQLWLVCLSSFLLCFLFFCFDYSALLGFGNGVPAVIRLDENSMPSVAYSPDNLTDSTATLVYLNNDDVADERRRPMRNGDSCLGKYVYIQDLPDRFNQELLDHCESITPGSEQNMCPYLLNHGFGRSIQDSSGILSNTSWYLTNQFMLEVIFHSRMKQYRCLTNDSSLASAVYVPFYAGLDISRYLWGFGASARDRSGFDLLKLLSDKPEWSRMYGRDHFMVAGRISWDFRRRTDSESDWGSKLRFMPESNNMSMLAIESSSWNNDYAIPYPTCFHPLKRRDVLEWQDKLRRKERHYLFSFAGAPRPDLDNSIRGRIMEECQASKKLCKLLECTYAEKGAITCDNPVNVMKVFQDSVFCLQPAGDSYTRRSTFDAILAGCIPVFFHPGTAYAQYKWHLPKNYSRYSVFLPVKDVKDWKAGVNRTLLEIPADRVAAMREEVIGLIPRVIYADSGNDFEDAFDLAVKGILERIERVRKEISEGNDPAIGFAEGDDYKYTFGMYVNET